MNNHLKKLISCILTVLILMTAVPLSGLSSSFEWLNLGITASAATLETNGKCGENAIYTFDPENGLLTIGGTGAIDDSAFELHREIKSVVIENGITEIGDSAFNACVNIIEVTIPDSVTRIGKYIFDGCGNILSITIPSSVTSISENAFGNQKLFVYQGSYAEEYASSNGLNYCTLLDIPEDPGYVEAEISYYYFWKVDKNTQTLTVTRKNQSSFTGDAPWLPYKEYIKHIVVADGTKEIDTGSFVYCDRAIDVSIPTTVTLIGKDAFYGCKALTEITLPNSIEYIYGGAFRNCTGLSRVVVPESTKGVLSQAFSNCLNLVSVTLPSSLGYINSNLFYGCGKLAEITIPDKATYIGDYAFYGCKSMSSVVIPDTVTSIGAYAFDDCTGIKELSIPCSAVLPAGGYAFGNCVNIEKISVTVGSGTMQNFGPTGQNKIAIYNTAPWYVSRNNLKEFSIADSIANIGDYAFCGFDKASEITIPQTVTKIGEYAFADCTELTKLDIPNSVESIGAGAFSGCSKINKINIPSQITGIEESTFDGCSVLADISIPNGVTNIGAAAFRGCAKLEKVIIPSGVTKIEPNTFNGCSSLKDINIHSEITSIGDGAFQSCKGLESIELIYKTESVGASAFAECDSLKKLTVYNRNCALGENFVAEGTVLYGFTGSTTEKYADNNGIEFVSIDAIHAHEYDYSCDRICKICGAERDAYHVYDSVCDEDCNVCGKKRIAPHIDEDENFYCDLCGAYLLDIAIDERKEVEVNAGETVYLKFSPPFTAKYIFYSSAYPKGTVGYICDSEKNVLIRREGYYDVDGFDIETVLYKGNIYYLGVQFFYPTESGTIPVGLMVDDEDHLFTHIEHRDSTCTEHGYDKVVCDYCGEVISVTELPFKHSYTSVVTAPTCTEKGYTTYTCSLCSYSYIGDYTPATNHPTRSWHMAKNPTVSSTGLMEEICDICGKKTNEKEIPMLKPDFVTGITLTPNKLALNVGDTAKITAEVRPSTAIDRSVIWSSTDTDIATVDGGIVTAKAPGVAVIVAETADGGYKDLCVVRVASIIGTNGAVVDNENGVIYGITGRPESIVGYLKTVDDSLTVQSNSEPFGTGSVVNVMRNGETVDSYKVVVFGDVNGDGWYDGQDAVTVSMIASGMLTREQVGEAAWIAADCNHDGIIDQADVELLNRAGVLLSKVDQTKSNEELIETSSEYVEYLNLIDQKSAETEIDNRPDGKPGFMTRIVELLKHIAEWIINLFSKLIK